MNGPLSRMDLGSFLLLVFFELEMRRMNMKKTAYVLAFCLCQACGLSEVGTWDGQYMEGGEGGVENPFRKVCCVTGIDFPGGRDWTDGSQAVQSRCSLVVFADGIPAMRLPVGDGYEISPDPDAHRMHDGDLYTFFSKNGASVVKKNGRPLFRYEGDEVLVDMLIREGEVHTLTGKRSGGFSYRRNGQPLVERFSGRLFGKLWEDGDSVCFAFTHPVATSDSMDERCYISVDSKVTQVDFESEVERIWDIRSRKGVPVCLVSSIRWGSTMIYEADRRRRISLPPSAAMLSCTMFAADRQIGVECVYTYEDGSCESGLWVEGAEYVRFEAGRSIFSFCFTDGEAYCVLNPEEDSGLIFSAGQMYMMPDGYSCAGEQAVAVSNGDMYVALTSETGGRPVLWHGEKLDTLKMNGYLCSVSFTGEDEWGRQ